MVPTGRPGTRSIPARFRPGRKPLTEGAAGVFGNGQDQKARNDSLMGEMDRQYLETPFYGSRRMGPGWRGMGYR